MSRGEYIVVEGQDGTGKSTQVAMLGEYFRSQGREVVIYDESGGGEEFSTERTQELRREVLSKELGLTGVERVRRYTEIRKTLWREFAMPALGRGAIVLTARNWFSTLIYQGYGEGVDLDFIKKFTRENMPDEYFNPDAIFVLLLSDAERQRRMHGRDKSASQADYFESQPQEFQDRLNHGYESVAKDCGATIIDAAPKPDEIQAEILDLLRKSS